MLWKTISVAFVVSAVMVFPAAAQRLGSGPSDPPPTGFSGQQYVDGQGCAFVRAGHGGRVTWVRRVGVDRRPICGLTPTRIMMQQAKADLDTQTPSVPSVRQTQPALRSAPATVPVVAPPVVAPSQAPRGGTAQPRRMPAQALQPTRTPGCPPDASSGEQFELTDGREVIVCTRPGHRISGARRIELGLARSVTPASPQQETARQARVPDGYRLAWKDDRLNPQRGPRTPQGDAQMHARFVATPQGVLVARATSDQAGKPRVSMVASKGQVGEESRTTTRPAPGLSAVYVQAGSFAVAANGRAAVEKLQALGLPVQVHAGRINGKAVDVVQIGPFVSGQAASPALSLVRRAGFSDAFLRR